MELHRANVVQMTQQGEQATTQLVVPHLDLVVVTSGHEEGLRFVEVNSTHGAIVLVKSIDKRAHAIVPQLDDSAVQARQDPWPLRVEAQAFDPI